MLSWVIIFSLILVNIGLFIWIGIERVSGDNKVWNGRVERVGALEANVFVQGAEEPFLMQPSGEAYLRRYYEFLLILDDHGDVIFSWNQPEDIPDHYSLGDVAGFSRWYLQDYPVRVWQGDRGLLVAAEPKGSRWKHGVEFSEGFMENLGRYLITFLTVNLLVVLFSVIVLGYSYYRSLKPLSEGIKALSENRNIQLKEKGVTSQLAEQLNRASRLLWQQRRALENRDTARTEWIAGVSHDIRTPLSVIVGYADEFTQKENLSLEEKRKAETIKTQSLRISQLIEDLNLTSKLEYQMQPLRIRTIYPARLLRKLTAERLNEGIGEQYDLSLEIQPQLEQITLEGDEALMERAVRNLIDNSIRHNPSGCRIWIYGSMVKGQVVISVLDDGKGIPKEVIQILQEESGTKEKPHIMGLRIVKQIASAHKGGFRITEEGHCVKLFFPMPHTGT